MTMKRVFWMSVALLPMLASLPSVGGAADLAKLDRYDQRRDGIDEQPVAEQASAHLELARWCQREQLPKRMRAHGWMAVQLDPNLIEAHRLLGNVRVGDSWVGSEEFAAQEAEFEATQRSFRKYDRKLQRMVQLATVGETRSREPRSREPRSHEAIVAAIGDQLHRINDADAIPAITRAVLTGESALATAGIDWLKQRREPEAVVAVARIATLDQRMGLREIASDHLTGQNPDVWVPRLLSWCEGDWTATHELVTSPTGVAVRVERMVEKDEGLSVERTIVATNVQIDRSALRGSPGFTSDVAFIDADRGIASDRDRDAMASRDWAEADNLRIQRVVARAAKLLSRIDGSIPDDATKGDLVRWWHARYGYEKLDRETVAGRSDSVPRLIENTYVRRLSNHMQYGSAGTPGGMNVVSLSPDSGTGAGSQPNTRPGMINAGIGSTITNPMPPVRMAGDCLVAGTLVWTDAGPRAIETLRTGDQVLSCNIATGEISTQSVLRPTRREPTPLVEIVLVSETITASPGHPFWVVGAGWVMAGDLTAGMSLHGVDGESVVQEIVEREPAATFNLVVDRNRSYFVGQAKVLTHDVRLRDGNTGPLPGVAAAL